VQNARYPIFFDRGSLRFCLADNYPGLGPCRGDNDLRQGLAGQGEDPGLDDL